MASSYPALAAAGLAKWASVEVTYCGGFSLPGLSTAQVDAIFDSSMAKWASVCGLRPRRATSRMNIIPGAGRIDGGGGTLAYSYMPGDPSPMSDQLQQVYDNTENWDAKWFSDVVLHELGHAFGLDHHDDPSSIMYPWSNGRNTGFSSWEIDQMVARYGPAAVVPQDPPPSDPAVPVPQTPTESLIDIAGLVLGSMYRLRIERWKK